MATSLISKMNHCNSPIYNVVFTITSHSEKLYKVVKRLTLRQGTDDPPNSKESMDNLLTSTTENVDSLCCITKIFQGFLIRTSIICVCLIILYIIYVNLYIRILFENLFKGDHE